MSLKRRVLVLTPWVPYPVTGACQQDRFNGLKQMKEMGYEVHVIAKIHGFQPRAEAEEAFRKEGIPLTLLPYVQSLPKLLLRRLPRIIMSPALLDGAALEYTDPVYEQVVKDEVERCKPDVVWIEYSLMWPVLRLLKPYNIPTIVKSSLNEPYNCRDENGWSISSIIKAIPKYPGETIAATESSAILAITPVEEEWYRSRGALHAATLPLRGLSRCFREKTHTDKDILDVVFLGSNYNMGHNRDAVEFLLKQIVPLVREQMPGTFRFNITGSKFPKSLEQYLGDDARMTGFVPDIGEFLATMDIALCPWISGHGMQQKVFEPMCRGLPMITTKTAGYDFVPGVEVRLAHTPQEYVDHLRILQSKDERQRQADAARNKAKMLFSAETVKHIVEDTIESVLVES